MAVYNLERLFEPKTICVVSAGNGNQTIRDSIACNLESGGFAGEIIVTTRHTKKLFGRSKGLAGLNGSRPPVDLVIAAAPTNEILPIIEDCVEIGAGGVILTASYAKTAGLNGSSLENSISRIVDKTGIRVVGPNSNGIISRKARMNASLIQIMPLSGKIALISQSGSIGASILDLSFKKQMGFSYYAGLGSMPDVEFGDLIDYIGGDPGVSSIVMYAENLIRFRNFMSAARKVSRIKPIIALKAGRTAGGAAAAAAHTGEGAGDDAVYDEAFRRAGIVRVKTFEELFDCAELLAKQQQPSGPGLAIITNAGGPGVMAADAMTDHGSKPMMLSTDVINDLDKILPPDWSRRNPIDIQGDADGHRYCRVIEACRNSHDIHAFLVIYAPQGHADSVQVAEALIRLFQAKPHILFASWMGGEHVKSACEILNRAGIPTFDTPERAVRAFMDLYHYSQNLKMLQEIPPKLPRKLEYDTRSAQTVIQRALSQGETWLASHDTDALLRAYGLNRIPEIQDPFFEKNTPPARGETNHELPEQNHETLKRNIQYEHIPLCIGALTDKCFGPVIVFGAGNGMPENFNTLAISLPPLNRLLAHRLMEKSDIFPLLQSNRTLTPFHFVFLEEMLTRISQLMTDFADIDTLIINPFYLSQGQASAENCRIHISPALVQSPMHLVISAYPNQYEFEVALEDIGHLLIRPIKPEDAPLLSDLFDSLSPKTIYYRFFTPMKSLPSHMLARFTQIDYDREIALVAIQESNTEEKMVGVSRVILAKDQKSAEFAVVVSDEWQGKGVGAELLKRCLLIAGERNIREVYGVVLVENTTMLALGKKLGFDMKIISGGSEYELRIKLSPITHFSLPCRRHELQLAEKVDRQ